MSSLQYTRMSEPNVAKASPEHDLATLGIRTWNRYAFARDHGHIQFVERADTCSAFFRGEQWRSEDIAALRAAGRPHLTINKIKPTISNLMGEQIQSRSEIAFRPKDGAPPETAETLTKLFKHISETQQLDWKRSDLFADGLITSRGFIDIRMCWDESMTGDVEYTLLNSKNVVVDPDADQMDPDTWNEVFVTKWLTIDDIELLYGKDKAELLRGRETSTLPFGYDSIDRMRDRFGERFAYAYAGVYEEANVQRNIRAVERQHRVLTRRKHLVDLKTGDMRAIPEEWDAKRIDAVRQQYGLGVTTKLVKRIKWDVVADGVVMHSDWSPYKHFTPVPFFPYFMHGHALGYVEDLLDPQELLNKALSQELHIVNATANGGWKIKAGSLTNMSIEELEQKGSQTGLVLELDDIKDADKITANATPQGLDRLSYKAEEHIKGISNVSDSMQGQDRADVAAKAIQQKRQAGTAAHANPLDSLVRTDFFIARNTLDLVQEYFTEERILTITHDRTTGATENITINQVTPEGTVVNDLSLGEYEVVISSVPQRETLEDTQFEQALEMRKEGIAIDDQTIIESSRLMKKGEIIKAMQAKTSSPEAQEQAQLNRREQIANIEKIESETAQKKADAGLKGAKTAKDAVSAHKDALTPPEQSADPAVEAAKAQQEMALKQQKQQHDMELDRQKFEHQKELDRQKFDHQAVMEQQQAARESVAARKSKPKPKPKGAPA